jgi:hypothetical protein
MPEEPIIPEITQYNMGTLLDTIPVRLNYNLCLLRLL